MEGTKDETWGKNSAAIIQTVCKKDPQKMRLFGKIRGNDFQKKKIDFSKL